MAIETLFEQCRRIVRSVMQGRDWRLLDEETFVRGVFTQMEGSKEVSADQIAKVATRVYGKVWHDACSVSIAHQERAYAEAINYFDKFARKQGFVEDDAAEIAQLSEMRLINSFDSEKARCKTPESFLPFLYFTYRAAKTEFLRNQKRALEEPLDDDTVPPGPGIEKLLICKELRAELLLRLEELVQERPHARDQLLAFYMKFLLGLSDTEIAQQLGQTSKRVQELRALGKQVLKVDDRLWKIFQDLAKHCW